MTPEQIAGQHISGEIMPNQIVGGNLPPGMLQGQPGQPAPPDPQRDEMISSMMQQMQMMTVERDRLSEERDKAMEMLKQAQTMSVDSHHRRTAP